MICAVLYTVKPPFQVSLGIVRFEHYTQEILKWRIFGAEIIDLGSLK
jgi:hypothetical protein